MNPYDNMPEHVRRCVERAQAMNRKAARTWKAARLASGFETMQRVRREFDAHRALAAGSEVLHAR